MANTLERKWRRISRWPFGKYIFSFLLGRYIPYTGSMSSTILELQPGFARITLRDRRKVRNHLSSVHAIALANLAEFTGNLALACGLPDDARFIPRALSMEYVKKARGRLTGISQTPVVESNERREIEVHVEIRDAQEDVVARCVLKTVVGPKTNK